jgi:hypothetical protein
MGRGRRLETGDRSQETGFRIQEREDESQQTGNQSQDYGDRLLDAEGSADVADVKSFRDLLVWQAAHEPVLAVYRETKAYPKHKTQEMT